MKNKLMMFVLLGMILLSLSSVSAFEWDNVKSYDPVTREVTIKNAFGLGADIGKARLNTPLLVKVGTGYQKVAEFDLWAYQDYNDILKSIEFYDKNKVDWQKNKLSIDYDIKFKTYKNVLVDDFKTECSKKQSLNGTTYEDCIQVKVGSHYENQEVWEKVTSTDLKKNEFVTIGIFTDVQTGDYVEWIPRIYGVRVEEWAGYTNVDVFSDDFSTNTASYYTCVAWDGGCGSPSVTGGEFVSANYGCNTRTYYRNDQTLDLVNKNYRIELKTKSSGANWGIAGIVVGANWVAGSRDAVVFGTTEDGGDITRLYKFVDGNYILLNATAGTYDKDTYYSLKLEYFKDNQTWYAYEGGNLKGNAKITDERIYSTTAKFGLGFRAFTGGFDLYGDDLVVTEMIFVGDAAPNITLNSPSSANYTTSPQNIKMNFSVWDDVNLSDVKLYVNGVLNQTNASGLNNSIYLFDLTLGDGDYTIYGKATDNESQSTNSSSIRIYIDSEPPILNLSQEITNQTTLTLPINVTLNYSATDYSNVSSCWYGYNGTNTTFTCNTAQNISISSSGLKTISYYANDTLGNIASNSTSFYVYYITSNATATNPITESGISSHSFYLNMTDISNFNATAELYWNGTSYGLGTKTTLSNDSLRFDKNLIVPSINGTSVNWTWVYNISGNPNVTNYNLTGSQTYIKVNITECGAETYQILNYTLYDQETRALGSTANASIEVDLTLTSQTNNSLSWQYHATKTSSTSFLICLPSGALNNSAFNLDSVSKYTYQDRVIQYHYIENFNLTNSSIPQTIRLYPLATAKSTSFIVNYQDENYIYVENAVIDVWRRYVGDGVFFSVEHAKTDANGQTRLHLVTEDIIYKFLVRQDGELVYTSPEFLALCQATPCQINLRQSTEDTNGFSKRDNLIYDYDFNKTTRTASFAFATKDNTQTKINMTILSSNQYENDTVCTTSLTTSGGQIDCVIPTAYTNTSYQTIIYQDGQYFGTAFNSLAPSSVEIFGYTGLILTAISYLMLALMGISSGIATIVFGIIGLVFMGLIQVFETGSVFGMASAILWLIVAGIIIITKITKRRIQ